MAEALVSGVLEQLTAVAGEGIQQKVRLVVGVDEEVKKLSSNLEAIQAVLVDAEARQVTETAVRRWLDQLKQASYDIEDVLDEWNYAILKQKLEGVEDATGPKKKVCFFFPSYCFSFKQVSLRNDIAIKIKEVNENLDVITKQKERYSFNTMTRVERPEHIQTTSFIDVSEEMCGQDAYKSILIDKLCVSTEQRLPIISLIGMGGIGKTTFAQFAYNHDKVINSFHERIWVCVSEPFDEHRIAKAIIESLGNSTKDLSELQSLHQRIGTLIQSKKCFLVLDDVWSEDFKKWERLYRCLKNSAHRSKILITTRKKSVVEMMGSIDIIDVQGLSDDECWLLFKQLAFFGRPTEECEKLEEIGKKISSKCKGLPLAVKTLGSLLRFKKRWEEWKHVLDSELWKLEKIEEDVFVPLLLSYNELPCMMKRCFVYCAIFPKDYRLKKDELIKLWMAQGYVKEEENKAMEIVGEEYFDYLASRSLFQEFEKDDENNVIACKMHDLVHDFAQFLSKNECAHIEVDGSKEPLISSSNHEKVCHIMVTMYGEDLFLDSIFRLRMMRSFLNDTENFMATLPRDTMPKLFGELTCLRALNIAKRSHRNSLIEEIPKEVGKLIHLRYLNLSHLRIKKLPEALCELYNLQTLDISNCFLLEELPQGVEKLINLRHLKNDETRSLKYIPKGIRRLSNLRTLRYFVISGSNDEKACSLEGLKYLNLFGELRIKMLGNVPDVKEVKTSPLKNHENLVGLGLDFNKVIDGRERRNEEDEALLEILQPSSNLEKLNIRRYRGNTILPNWMMSLTKLRELALYNCDNCKHLPPLGELPSLEYLDIRFMNSLKSVSNELLRKENDDTSSSSVFFPKLKRIKFLWLREWEEWDHEITRIGDEEEVITIMPSLVSLEIYDCPKLKSLPKHLVQNTRLKKEISHCPLLGYRGWSQ
ncbi:putative disease resistance protein RGA3 [Mangifera indica]|uniref:putative disease resistance protein RGA3 n=1 Tax=Mangifera indica TaxID=29780 RepID=UPI001CF9D145|nr:putative disease resistance protein RGA3 [Mangifera indica]XP_044474124.1 putative disease resistance protein RGA3 [Mangifera indica]XP_044474133.1 putative disease resistance protein RGA3 [Mangifera indica]XP_044474141.1 putative disease resistance protein RGA3 [Mangifera indica]XP_044474148.1 putative disease resistance protein RGA3 [Mangifera indica]XP_044474157.1 putative disease resistance protein RGA3 [Mangifera indica]XP_044474165.1 putative disease resistance protein RGA3 [Mangifer